MRDGADSWVTLAEMIHRSDLNNLEEPFHDQLQREVSAFLKLQDAACGMLRRPPEMVQILLADTAVLTAKLAAAEAEIRNLMEGNRKGVRSGTADMN
jgi:hypothetical protein